ncbi:hypothetical protein [Hydrogenophaga sp.]|uniref:hypothetical protein n=1 Tax=Hydrogenophaga sp. TaxID=1904254 RepID=UPI0025C07F5A|nr:hypothetical protein [Hydrogenophaga sp.]MBT9462528.1 hypothetical protein [Hydrogenophaga sp.]
MTDKRYSIGMLVTIAYVVALAIYAYVQRDPVMKMTPNELGDALAGAASPLAFLWLVLGYLQQGEELRQNTTALNLQVKELQASVDQQRALVETTQRQHEFELAREEERRRATFLSNQPVFDVQLAGGLVHHGKDLFYLTMTNMGRLCSRLAIYADEDESLLFEGEELPLIFNGGTAVEMSFALSVQHIGQDLSCVICYTDWNGEERKQRFAIRVAKRKSGDLLAYIPAPPVLVFPEARAAPSPKATT